MEKSLTKTLYLPDIFSSPFRLKFNFKIIGVLFFALLLFLSAFYIMQINSVISKSYLIQKAEARLATLEKENRNLEIDFTRANSLASVEILVTRLNFEKVQGVSYIKVLKNRVARE